MAMSVLFLGRRTESQQLARSFEGGGFRVLFASQPADALRQISATGPEFVVLDSEAGDTRTGKLLRQVQSLEKPPVLLFDGSPSATALVETLRATGRPTSPEKRAQPISGSEAGESVDRLLGRSAAMRCTRAQIDALAPLSVPVLFKGESGTGRLDAAKRLHRQAPLVADARFVHVECSPERRTPNLRERAFVFLDEVSRLCSEDQQSVLAWLRSAEEEGNPFELRVCASTSEDLDQLASEDRFLPPLADLLGQFTIAIEPLRSRDEDILDLVPAWSEKLCASLGRPPAKIAGSVLQELRTQRWSGNVSELIGSLEKLLAFCSKSRITRSDVQRLVPESPQRVQSMRERRERQQREELTDLLEKCGGNLAAVARELGISRGAVIYRAQKYALLKS